jgi:integrase
MGKTGEERRPTERRNFTKKYIEALVADDKRITVYDQKTRGLGILVQPTGTKSFFWFRKVAGKGDWRKIGEFPAVTVEQARIKANEHNANLAKWKGADYDGPNPFERRPNLSFNDVIEHYIVHHVRKHSTNPTKAEKGDRRLLETYLRPWKDRRISSMQKSDLIQLHTRIASEHGPTAANRLVTKLRTLFYYAQDKLEWTGKNPARNPGKSKIIVDEKPRKRFLKREEMPKFFTALRAEPSRDLQDFTVIALFCGARSGDILGMRWADVDLDAGLWRCPNQKSPKHPYEVVLVPEIIEQLRKRPRASSPFVFPSRGKTGHLTNVTRSWKGLLERAGVSDLTRHDLRRTFGTWQQSGNTSAPVIGATLGHTSLAATRVYARVEPGAVRDAVTLATRAMLAAGEEKATP